MKTQFSIICAVIVLFISCKNDTTKTVTRIPENISVVDTLQLKFNEGEKWIANPETHIGVKNMDSIIKVFKRENSNDYLALGESLSHQTSYIIKKCSMKGEPHDQLHVVLVPMLDEIFVLREDKVHTETKSAALERLDLLINKYFQFFKII